MFVYILSVDEGKMQVVEIDESLLDNSVSKGIAVECFLNEHEYDLTGVEWWMSQVPISVGMDKWEPEQLDYFNLDLQLKPLSVCEILELAVKKENQELVLNLRRTPKTWNPSEEIWEYSFEFGAEDRRPKIAVSDPSGVTAETAEVYVSRVWVNRKDEVFLELQDIYGEVLSEGLRSSDVVPGHLQFVIQSIHS